jgi:hypothetical protein
LAGGGVAVFLGSNRVASLVLTEEDHSPFFVVHEFVVRVELIDLFVVLLGAERSNQTAMRWLRQFS